MRKVFSSIELSETVLVRDALLPDGIEAVIQNEYSGRTAIPAFRPPAAVWIRQEGDYEKARWLVIETIATLDKDSDARPWACAGCRAENPQSFEICWSCGREKGAAGSVE